MQIPNSTQHYQCWYVRPKNDQLLAHPMQGRVSVYSMCVCIHSESDMPKVLLRVEIKERDSFWIMQGFISAYCSIRSNWVHYIPIQSH